jgi:transposase
MIKDVIKRNKRQHGLPTTFITDNAHVHSKEQLEDLDKSDSTRFVCTPKYCPDLNLCEFWFGKVNAVFRSCHFAMEGLKLDQW